MSDGQNTDQFTLRDPYRSGPSPVWKDPATGAYSYFDETRGEYFRLSDGAWHAEPDGGGDARNLTWPELFDEMSVAHYAYHLKARATGGNWRAYYDEIYGHVAASDKNDRASAICAAARDAGVIVFAVGMDTYGQGDATLADCASSPAHFFDVEAEDIGQAFSAIARQINQLRLTQ
jgi:hypothetical protein